MLVPIGGDTYVQKSIALAYKSRIAMGGALRDRGDFVGETDTVYGGCFKRQRLLEIGMYDGEMVRNQDDELSFRLRERGEKSSKTAELRSNIGQGDFIGNCLNNLCNMATGRLWS